MIGFNHSISNSRFRFFIYNISIMVVILLFGVLAFAGPMDQAITMHKRLTGVSPDTNTHQQMADLISQGQVQQAAEVALGNPNFYNLTLKNFFAAWSNEAGTPLIPLNDTTATLVGIVRDDRPFTEALTGNIVYTGANNLDNVQPYSSQPNDAIEHFTDFENNFSLASTANLIARNQSQINNIDDYAGVLTTQAYGQAFFEAGTNRRVWKSLVETFWCKELEQIRDTSLPGVRIRRDVDRAPGGDPSVFANKCLGCHALQDAAAGAFSYFDYTEDDGLLHNSNNVPDKINRNEHVYPEGYITTNDSWAFLGGFSSTQSFAQFGWRGPTSGFGLRSLASAIAESRGFASCMATKVFMRVCMKTEEQITVEDQGYIQTLASNFEANGRYSMRNLFAETATLCIGE